MSMRKRAKRRKSRMKQSRMCNFIIVITMIIVCVVSTAKSIELNNKSRELSEVEQVLQSRIEAAQVESETLVAQEQYMNTKKYIEDVAKEKLGLVYPDEIMIKANE